MPVDFPFEFADEAGQDIVVGVKRHDVVARRRPRARGLGLKRTAIAILANALKARIISRNNLRSGRAILRLRLRTRTAIVNDDCLEIAVRLGDERIQAPRQVLFGPIDWNDIRNPHITLPCPT